MPPHNSLIVFSQFLTFLEEFNKTHLFETVKSLTAHPNQHMDLSNYLPFPSELIHVMNDFYNQYDNHPTYESQRLLFDDLIALHMGFD